MKSYNCTVLVKNAVEKHSFIYLFDVMMFYKNNSNLGNFYFATEILLGFQGSRKSHDRKFMPLSASVNPLKLMLIISGTIPAWSILKIE